MCFHLCFYRGDNTSYAMCRNGNIYTSRTLQQANPGLLCAKRNDVAQDDGAVTAGSTSSSRAAWAWTGKQGNCTFDVNERTSSPYKNGATCYGSLHPGFTGPRRT